MPVARLLRASASTPYDAEAAVERLLTRLRQQIGASRVAVWVHEATTETVVPYRQSVSAETTPGSGPLVLHHAMPVAGSPLMSAVVHGRRPVRVEDGNPDAFAPGIAARFGVGSVHGEPLLFGDRVVGVLTVEPAAAAGDRVGQAAPAIARALSAARTRRSEARRLSWPADRLVS